MRLDIENMTPEELRARMEAVDTPIKETDMVFEVENFEKIIEHWASIEGITSEDAATKAKQEAYEMAGLLTDKRFSIPTRAQFVTAILERRAKA